MHYHIMASAVSSHVQIFVACVACVGPQVFMQSSSVHTFCPAGLSSLSCSAVDSQLCKQLQDTIVPDTAMFLGCRVLLGTARVSSGSPAVLVFSSSHGLVSSKGAGYACLFLSPSLKLPNLSSTSEPASVRNRTVSRDLFI